jgi:hypothetical protein
MRRLTLVVFALMLCSIASAVPINLTIDWATSHTARQFYNCAYNPATGHLIQNGGDMLYVFDASDGSFVRNLATAGGFPFSLACTSDGVLFGTDLSYGGVMNYWADDTTSPAVFKASEHTILGRGLNARGTGSSPTLYLAGGGDNDKAEILQATDGTLTTFTVVSTIPAPFSKSYIGVQNASRVLGMQPWGTDGHTSPNLGFPDVANKVGDGYAYSQWVRDDTFYPGDAFGWSYGYQLGGDYADGAWIMLNYFPGQLVALEAQHGALLDQIPVPTYGGNSSGYDVISFYGNAVTDPANDTIYWGGRLRTAGGSWYGLGHMGKATYTPPKPVINELDYDDAGSDDREFIEIMGPPGYDISNYMVVGVTAFDNSEYSTYTVPAATTIPADGFYVMGSSLVPNVDQVIGASDLFQNGSPDAVVLKDDTGAIIDALGYEFGAGGGAGALTADRYEGTPYMAGDSFGAWVSIGRKNDMVDTDDNNADFDINKQTPGEKNQQFTLWADDMPYVDTMTNPTALSWWGDFVDVYSVNPASVGAPDSPEAVIPGLITTASPDQVGRTDDPSGGGNSNMLGDHEINQADINIQGWAYVGVTEERTGFWVRGIAEPAWMSSSSDYQNCYAIEYYDDGTTQVLRAIKALSSDGSKTVLGADYSITAPGWHHMRIFANGTNVRAYLDSAKIADVTDSDIATGSVGIGFREGHAGGPTHGGLVDSIIIDDNFTDAVTQVPDWNLF